MAIVHQTSSTASGTGTSITVNKPTGTVSGDVLVASLEAGSNISAAPSGWVQIVDGGANFDQFYAYYKIAGGSEPASYTWTVGSSPWRGGISRFSGVNQTTPIDVAAVHASNPFANTVSASVTTVTANAMVVGSGAQTNNSTPTATVAPPAALTERWEVSSVNLASAIQAAAGSTGTLTWTFTGGVVPFGVWLTALRAADNPPTNTVAPAITTDGTPQTGETVTCSTGTWTDSPSSFAYQWKRNGTSIVGATTSSYVLDAADVAQSVKCTVTATNANGSTAQDSNTITPAAPAAPANTVAPAISGNTWTGQTVTVSDGTWTGSPSGYTYQWKRNGSNIAGATNNTYLLDVADEAQNIKATVTATNTGGSTNQDSNTVVPTAAPTAPANTSAPVISGTAEEGQTLTCSTGTWTASPTAYAYQWKRGGVDIAGAMSSTHTVVPADVGQNIKCTVTATNAQGSGTADSNTVVPTAAVVVTALDYERLTVDPDTTNAIALHADPFNLEAFEPGVAQPRPGWVTGPDTDGALLDEEPRYDNVEMTIRVRVGLNSSLDMDTALVYLGQLQDKLQQAAQLPGGLPIDWVPTGSTKTFRVYAVLATIEDLPITWQGDMVGWFLAKPVVNVHLTRRPFLYGEEVVVTPATTQSTPVMDLTVGSVPGDVAAEGRLILSETAGVERRHVEVGVEQRHYNAAAPIILDSASLTTSGFTGTSGALAGAYGGTAITSPVTTQVTAVAGIPSGQPHIGTFRIKARVKHGATAVRSRLSWRVAGGELVSNPYTSAPVSATAAGGYSEVDYGLITIPEPALGTQSWSGQIEAIATGMVDDNGTVVSTQTFILDALWLIPCEHAYTVMRSNYKAKPGAVSGFDSFTNTTAGGSLDTRVAPAGGTWASGGATTDFQFSDSIGESLVRTTTTDTGTTPGGRFARLGAARTDTDVSARVRINSPGNQSVLLGVVARYVSSTSMVWAFIRAGSGGNGDFNLYSSVAGSFKMLGFTRKVAPAPGVWYRVRLITYQSGHIIAELYADGGSAPLVTLDAFSTDTATGGSLASGTAGIMDQNSTGASITRYYDDVYVATPAPDPIVMNANRQLEVRHDGNFRQAVTTTRWGLPPASRGGRLFIPPAGDLGLTSHVVWKARRTDVEVSEDTIINDPLTGELRYRPRYLTPR